MPFEDCRGAGEYDADDFIRTEEDRFTLTQYRLMGDGNGWGY